MTIIASIHGRTGKDGELRTSASGKAWCRVSVACEAGTDRESGEALTQWLTLVAFGRVAEERARPARARRSALATEQRDLMPDHDDQWAIIEHINPLRDTIIPWSPYTAYRIFLDRYTELWSRN